MTTVEAPVSRLLAVLETRLPGLLDEVEAETFRKDVTLGSFVASTSTHSVTVYGTTYGTVTGATQEAVLAALHALILAGESTYAAVVEGSGASAVLRVTPDSTVVAATNTTVTATTVATEFGALTNPVDYRDLATDEPDPQYPAVYVEVEGSVDSEPWATTHETLTWPMAVWVVGQWGITEKAGNRVGRAYGEAVRRTLRRYGADNVAIDHIRTAATTEVISWGDGAQGRAAIVRLEAVKWAAAAA